eukprot:gnl/TRDRNA2_/TRDRNA2_208334_c0_seq1.p1 gnl/TRDRNA2_/TRDRNA2_208334_c0~~gnl/TRDRNA2_/TRDRNA2_208334_c0_seq1.p1  ORF type:complete len:239 (+),score=40.10 gnl/TRDRNA2_/TRDRNA2_208334_c0_seq1:99-815(+)
MDLQLARQTEVPSSIWELILREAHSWPVPLRSVWNLAGGQLEPYLEKPARWRQLCIAPPKAIHAFARSFLQRLPAVIDAASEVPPTPRQVLFSQLGLPCDTQHVSAQQLVLTESGVVHFLKELLEVLPQRAQADCTERLLIQWPTKQAPCAAVALLVAARLCEGSDAVGPDDPVPDALIDAAIASLYRGKPDCPLIRRHMLSLKFLEQRQLATPEHPAQTHINFKELQRAYNSLRRKA